MCLQDKISTLKLPLFKNCSQINLIISNKNFTNIIIVFFLNTVVGDNISIMKTTLRVILIYIKLLNSMDTQKYGNKKKL